MKRKLILTLVCLNVVLLAAVVWGPVRASKAQADQALTFRTTDYLMFSARYGLRQEAVCVVDLASRQMRAWVTTAARGGRFQVQALRGTRDLKRDFRRKGD